MNDRYELTTFDSANLDWIDADDADVTVISDRKTGAYVASSMTADRFVSSVR